MTWNESGVALQDALKALQKGLRGQEKALEDVLGGAAAAEVARLHDGLAALDPELLRRVGLAADGEAVRDGARERVQALRQEQRRAFAAALQAAAEAAGRACRRLGEDPPEFLVAPFTAAVDLQRMEATLLYAREEVGKAPARAEDVLAAAARAEKELNARQLPPEEWFDLLAAAWRAAAAVSGRPAGERLDLADVLPQMALLHQGRRFLEDPQREAFASYSKARFLYDLARLRSARILERGGLRLDLGTATGDSTKKKGRVFFLPDGVGGGQYYLTIRFVPGGRTG